MKQLIQIKTVTVYKLDGSTFNNKKDAENYVEQCITSIIVKLHKKSNVLGGKKDSLLRRDCIKAVRKNRTVLRNTVNTLNYINTLLWEPRHAITLVCYYVGEMYTSKTKLKIELRAALYKFICQYLESPSYIVAQTLIHALETDQRLNNLITLDINLNGKGSY